MARPSLSQVRSYGDFATTFRWNLRFPATLPSQVLAQASRFKNQNGQPFDTDPNALNVLCTSTAVPTKQVEKISVNVRGHVTHQPGIVRPQGSITLNFIETMRNHVHRLLYAWQEAMWQHDSGKGNLMRSQRETNRVALDELYLERLDTEDMPVCTYVLQWVFLENYTFAELDSNSSAFTATSTFSYDDYYILGWSDPTVRQPQ